MNYLRSLGGSAHKKEMCFGTNNTWCYFAVPENNCTTDQKKKICLKKSAARYIIIKKK